MLVLGDEGFLALVTTDQLGPPRGTRGNWHRYRCTNFHPGGRLRPPWPSNMRGHGRIALPPQVPAPCSLQAPSVQDHTSKTDAASDALPRTDSSRNYAGAHLQGRISTCLRKRGMSSKFPKEVLPQIRPERSQRKPTLFGPAQARKRSTDISRNQAVYVPIKIVASCKPHRHLPQPTGSRPDVLLKPEAMHPH